MAVFMERKEYYQERRGEVKHNVSETIGITVYGIGLCLKECWLRLAVIEKGVSGIVDNEKIIISQRLLFGYFDIVIFIKNIPKIII